MTEGQLYPQTAAASLMPVMPRALRCLRALVLSSTQLPALALLTKSLLLCTRPPPQPLQLCAVTAIPAACRGASRPNGTSCRWALRYSPACFPIWDYESHGHVLQKLCTFRAYTCTLLWQGALCILCVVIMLPNLR